MPETATYILLWSVGGSLITLMTFLAFINYILKLYNKKEIEHNTILNIQNIEKEKEILNNRIEVQEETIQKISREIHDNVNQLLTLTKLNISTLKKSSAAEFESKINLTNELLTDAINELSNLSRSLSAGLINEFGLIKSLESEIIRITQIDNIKINLTVSDRQRAVSPELCLPIYRIFQEATRNSIIHGNASIILVNLEINDSSILLQIEDDGNGFDINYCSSQEKRGQGITNMQKRATLLNGTLEISSIIHTGTKIRVTIPQTVSEALVNNFIPHTIHN